MSCSASSVTKAIKQSTYLTARKAEHEAAKSSGREVQIEGPLDQFAAAPEVEKEDRDDAELKHLIAEEQADARKRRLGRVVAAAERLAEHARAPIGKHIAAHRAYL